MDKLPRRPKEQPPTISEWASIRKLLPECEGVFRLCLRNTDVNPRKKQFEERALYAHFAPYNVISKSAKFTTVDSTEVAYISFPSFFTAYRAWREKDKTTVLGSQIGIEPAGGNANSLAVGTYIFVSQLPNGLLMSSLVTRFAKYYGLICINPLPREKSAVIAYSKLESGLKACSEINNILVDGNKHDIIVHLLAERPSIQFGTVNINQLKIVRNASAKIDNYPRIDREEEPTGGSRCSRRRGKKSKGTALNTTYKVSASSNYSDSSSRSSNSKKAEQDTKKSKHKNQQVVEQKKKVSVSSTADSSCSSSFSGNQHIPVEIEFRDIRLQDQRVCQFCINYQQFCHMFEVTYGKRPSLLQNIQTEIQFLVTHQIEPSRFWGWLMTDSKDSVRQLNKIEKKIASNIKMIPPPYVLPREGYCGVALYKNNWYRCYILSSNLQSDEIKVFYCDYGNSETLSKEDFRFTDANIWTLPPQAIPFEIYGDLSDMKQSLNKMAGLALKATVLESTNSQPHVMVIKNVTCLCSDQNSSSIIKCLWCNDIDVGNQDAVVENGNDSNVSLSESCNGTSVEGELFGMPSLFTCDDEDLVLGILSEAHHPNLIYLKFGDANQLSAFQKQIDKAELIIPTSFGKGKIFLLNVNGIRSRVVILQVFVGFSQVKVLHVDVGIIEWVSFKNLYHLDRELRESSFQVKPAALAGINCTGKIGEAVYCLKNKLETVVMVNVIRESPCGKIFVELFDLKTKRSINKDLIDNGLGIYETGGAEIGENISPDMIPVQELEAQITLLPSLERMLPETRKNELLSENGYCLQST